MDEPQDSDQTLDAPLVPADSLDAGLAVGFGRPADAPRSVLSELRPMLGSLRPVLLGDAEGESGLVVKPTSDAMPPPEQTGNRYQLSGEIVRGGMGAVLRGRDVDLGRDLAVKVLLEKYAGQPEVARRFIEEAQICGQLQHPGVVPVYDIGRFGDRAYFTMKLVKGKDAGGDPGRTLRAGRGPTAVTFDRSASGADAGLRPCQGCHSPRSEAGKHHGRGFRRGAGDGLGTGQGAGLGRNRRRGEGKQDASAARGLDDDSHRSEQRLGGKLRHGHGSGFGSGHSGLHAAGAGQRRHRPSRPPGRCLRPGCDPLRDPDLALLAANQIDAAVAEFRDAAKLKPDVAVVHYYLGLALATLGKLDEAVAAHRSAVRLDGKHAGEAIFALGELLRRLGRYDEAIETLHLAMDLARDEGRPDQVQRATWRKSASVT